MKEGKKSLTEVYDNSPTDKQTEGPWVGCKKNT